MDMFAWCDQTRAFGCDFCLFIQPVSVLCSPWFWRSGKGLNLLLFKRVLIIRCLLLTCLGRLVSGFVLKFNCINFRTLYSYLIYFVFMKMILKKDIVGSHMFYIAPSKRLLHAVLLIFFPASLPFVEFIKCKKILNAFGISDILAVCHLPRKTYSRVLT